MRLLAFTPNNKRFRCKFRVTTSTKSESFSSKTHFSLRSRARTFVLVPFALSLSLPLVPHTPNDVASPPMRLLRH
jgi:hypothetical protein